MLAAVHYGSRNSFLLGDRQRATPWPRGADGSFMRRRTVPSASGGSISSDKLVGRASPVMALVRRKAPYL